MAAIWKGALTFGLVNIPVDLRRRIISFPPKGGDKPYALLREAIRNTGSVGIGKIIIRQTQHLAAVKVVGDALVLEIMRFASELVDSKEFNFPARNAIRPQELQMAEQLVSNLAEPFDPARYTDDYRANLMRVIKAKMKGKKPSLESPQEGNQDSDVLDLMSRLRASLEEGAAKKGVVRTKRRAVAAGRKPAKSKKRRTA